MTLKTALLTVLITALAACAGPTGKPGALSAGADNQPVTVEPVPIAPTASSVGPDAIASDPAGTAVGSVASTGPANMTTPSTEQACTERGGTWRRAGIRQLEVCDIPTSDAGQPCQGDADCESICVAAEGAPTSGAVTGQCFASNITVGTCLTLVEGGQIANAQCAD